MKKQLIKAISFFYKGERHVIKVTSVGKFRVPVTEVVDGNMRTRVKSLTARQMLDHDVVKSCDPTLYLERGEKLRVFQGGDPGYLPAQVQGLVEKHDEANKPRKIPKLSFAIVEKCFAFVIQSSLTLYLFINSTTFLKSFRVFRSFEIINSTIRFSLRSHLL